MVINTNTLPFHQRLSVLCLLSGITQKELAKACGVRSQHAWRWFSGISKPSASNRKIILEQLAPHFPKLQPEELGLTSPGQDQ